MCDGLDNDRDSLIDDAGDVPRRETMVFRSRRRLRVPEHHREPLLKCSDPSLPGGDGHALNSDDRNDNDPTINPGVLEVCDDVDKISCDGVDDDYLKYLLHGRRRRCRRPQRLPARAVNQARARSVMDCDDTNPAINPNATERCDGIDNNCDALIDGSIPPIWPPTFRTLTKTDMAISQQKADYFCEAPAGFVANASTVTTNAVA